MDKFEKFFAALWVFAFALSGAMAVFTIYVAWHFIGKFW